jgi:hypothetical protein
MPPEIRTAPRQTSILAGLDECVTAPDMADCKRDEQAAPCTLPSAQISTSPAGSADAMAARPTTENSSRKGPASDQLHPFVYMAAVGLVVLFAVAAWASFDDGEYTGFLLAVMSGFFFMAVAIPCTLWLIWRRHQDVDAARVESVSWRTWARGEFDTWTGRRKAADAAVEILLPLAAVAFGMTGLGIVFHYIAAASAVHS